MTTGSEFDPMLAPPETMLDDEVRQHVIVELRHSDWTRHLTIDVDVQDGVVTLGGIAPGCALRKVTEQIVRGCPGVRSIVNRIMVETPCSGSCLLT